MRLREFVYDISLGTCLIMIMSVRVMGVCVSVCLVCHREERERGARWLEEEGGGMIPIILDLTADCCLYSNKMTRDPTSTAS